MTGNRVGVEPLSTSELRALVQAVARKAVYKDTVQTDSEDTLPPPYIHADMASEQQIMESIVDSGVVAVMRDIPEDDVVDVAHAIYEGGVTALELTADAKRCSELIADVDRALADTDAVVGAGTVRDAATARNVIEAGAEFVLAPNISEDVLEVCNRERVVAVPGVMTPTEADQAMATAVGAGSALVDYEAIENGDMDAVRESAAAFVEAVEDARN